MSLYLADPSHPAGGAPLEDLIPATLVALVGAVALVAVAIAYRRGGARPLRRAVGATSEALALPPWSALPTVLVRLSLVIAVFGFYWDVATHIDNGRDPGPFANPAHYFILAGLAGVFLAGILSVLVGTDGPTRTSIRLTDRWHAPLGGILILICGIVALLGFPLDDVWHRLFGQDVTLWGPTHVQMVGGASLASLASWVLLREAQIHRGEKERSQRRLALGNETLAAGAFLVGMSTLQGEFDFGVPQFSLVFHPILLMLAAGVTLVAARIRLGRGGALGAVLFFIALRGVLTILVGPVFGRSTLHLPLYLVEALIVEAVAARVGSERQLSLGLWAGLGIGTLGLGAEWLWSHLFMPLPWPAALLPEAAVFGLIAAVGGSILGALIGRCIASKDVARQHFPRWVGALAGVAVIACLALPLRTAEPPPINARVTLEEVAGPNGRWVNATVHLEPESAADGALWFNAFAWQGRNWDRGSSPIVELRETGPGDYVTTEPLPVYGEWKAMLRLHRDNWLGNLPIYMPEDSAIPAEEIPASSSFEREFRPDHEVLQREATGGSPLLMTVAYSILLAIAVLWIASMAWGLVRLERAIVEPDQPTSGGATYKAASSSIGSAPVPSA